MKINIEGNLLDYIDEQELKENIRYQIKKEIAHILENDKDIKTTIIKEIIEEVKDIQLTTEIKNALKEKIIDIIKKEYLQDKWQVKYEIGLTDKVKEIFDNNSETFNPIIYKAIDNALQDYKVENYELTRIGVDLIMKDEESINKIKEIFIDRLDEILEKI